MFVFIKARDIFAVTSFKPYYTLYYEVKLKEVNDQVQFVLLFRDCNGQLISKIVDLFEK